MSNLRRAFEEVEKQGERALVGYITCGDPSPRHTPVIAEALVKGGVDILELGIPFSDPIADGPTIQAASVRALEAGTTPLIALKTAHEIKKKHEVPLVILTYFNPIFRIGINNFFQRARSCQVDGVVVPDLPVEEASDYRKIAEKNEVDTIFIAAPSTSEERLQKIVSCTSGFLYLVSHYGVTGEKETVEKSTTQLVRRILCHAQNRIPVAVGFGISKPEHVREIVKAGADGVIVGSAFVKIIQQHQKNIDRLLEEVEKAAFSFKKATLRQSAN